MRTPVLIMIAISFLANTPSVLSAEKLNIKELRAELNVIRSDYETRIQALETRLAAAERQLAKTDSMPDVNHPTVPSAVIETVVGRSPGTTGDNVFNPAIGVIFQGQAWDYRHDPARYEIAGFPLAGEAGPVSEGLGLGETEIDISANVDDKFSAWLTLPVVIEDGMPVSK